MIYPCGEFASDNIELGVFMQEMAASVVDGSDPTGHIISTTIGGKNGEPKQVTILGISVLDLFHFQVYFLKG